MDDRLKQYLQDCKNKKLAWSQVEHVLQGSNYPSETIIEAKNWYETPINIVVPATPVKTTNEIKPKKKHGLFFVLLLLIILIAASFYGTIYAVIN